MLAVCVLEALIATFLMSGAIIRGSLSIENSDWSKMSSAVRSFIEEERMQVLDDFTPLSNVGIATNVGIVTNANEKYGSNGIDKPGNFISEREVRRLEASLRETAEINDRIMAQNIALLADLEAAQRAVRELRAGKDALALQLKRALARGE